MVGRFPVLYIAEADPEDAVLSSGVLAYLVESLPNATFTVVGSPESAPLFADTPRMRKLLVLEKEGHLEWLNLWSQVQSVRWGLIVDQRGTTFSGKLKRQKRAVRGKDEPGLHKVEQAARVLHLDEVPAPRLYLSETTQARADALVGPDDGPILALAPGAPWMGKIWPPERYALLAAALLADDGPMAGGRVIVVGDADAKEAAHLVRLSLKRNRVTELQGRLNPLETVAALSRATLFVGPDTIWTHLAVAAGAPALGLFNPSDDRERGPWNGMSVRGPRPVEDFRKIDPRLNQALQHMNDLPADRVIRAAKKLLSRIATSETDVAAR